jgi:hypothetical protein
MSFLEVTEKSSRKKILQTKSVLQFSSFDLGIPTTELTFFLSGKKL